MKSETEKLLATLKVLIEELSSSSTGIASEGGTPFQTFVCEETDKENFTIANYLNEINFFRSVPINTFLQDWQLKLPNHPLKSQMMDKYQELNELLSLHLIDLQAYELITNNEGNCIDKIYSDDEPFLILIGKTKDEDWIGLSPLWSEPGTCGYGSRLVRSIQPPSKAALNLKMEIEPILQELRFVIADAFKGYAPAKDIVWQVAPTKALLIEQLLESSRYMKTWEFHGFSDEFSQTYISNEYFEDEIPKGKNQVFEEVEGNKEELWWQQYEFEGYGDLKSETWNPNGFQYEFKLLEEFLFNNLRNRRIYVMGNRAIFRLYVVGRTKKSDWLGISTKAIWT